MLKNFFTTLMSTTALCFLLALSMTSQAAGFHYQLNLTARLATAPGGELTGVEMSWLYDPELSATLMDGEDLSEGNIEATLQKRAADILDGLQGMNYFTSILMDKQTLPTLKVEKYNLQLTDQGQLQLNLTLPFAEAKALQGHQLEIVVSDPTAVGLATFLSADKLLLNESQAANCQAPTLRQEQLGTAGDHILLSETMTLDCR